MKKALLPFGLLLLIVSILLINKLEQPGTDVAKNKKVVSDKYSKMAMNSEHKKTVKGYKKFDEPNKFAELQNKLRTRDGEDAPSYPPNYRMNEFLKAKSRKASMSNSTTEDLNWVERGPANVGGRTRGLIVDPDDPSGDTWFAASVGGGIWKTTNAGVNWIPLTDDIPSLSASYLAMAASNHNVIYAGTGEGFYNADAIIGQGIFKTTDKGDSWQQLASTANSDFFYVNRIVVDPDNENIVLAATNTGIFKSVDGGDSWTEVYSNGSRAQHLIANPLNFNTLYCAISGLGVVKSKDAGDTWFTAGDLDGGGRYEIAIASTDTNRIYAANESSILYMTADGGDTWLELEEENGVTIEWLGAQGWYDNTIAVHPYDEDIVFLGGIDNWKTTVTIGAVNGITEVETSGDFDSAFAPSYQGLTHFDGAVGTGNDYWNETVFNNDNLVEIELRSGAGKSQLAHRFLPNVFEYQDFIEMPFEVWDVTNNKQLAASFIDIDQNSEFNLRLTRGDVIFVHNVNYAATPDGNIAQDVSGIKYDNMYVIGLKAIVGFSWDPDNLPEATLSIFTGDVPVAFKNSEPITDGYDQYGPVEAGVHVDQHNLVMIPVDEGSNSFRILNGNDGGVGISDDGGETWRETDEAGYNTTQFYGVDKRNGADEYIGGTQDNGTWQSNPGENASATTNYLYRLGGDGFEVAWHHNDPLKMIGGSQYNTLYRTVDGWQTREAANVGFDDWSNSGNSPFISKIAESNSDPDLLFTISRAGVWRSDNFAENWTLAPIDAGDFHNGGYFSFASVEISVADPQVVWAGAYMSTSGHVFVSKDGGLTFSATPNYANLGLVSGISTHPTDPATAYALFSISGAPKILKTTNFGQSWEDISGFDGGAPSTRGFPDVAVYDLVVMPYDTDVIWAGTELGLFISTDGGGSWVYSDNGFPAVAIWDMKIVNDQVVVGTHGRGIWTVTLPELSGYQPPVVTLSPRLNSANLALNGITLNVSLRSEYDSTAVMLNNIKQKTIAENSVGDMDVTVETTLSGELDVQLVSYKDGREFKSATKSVFNATLLAPRNGYVNDFASNTDDFFSDNMTVDLINGFADEALHSAHPYENSQNYIALLRVPIVVASDDALLKYDDVAIVEPGDPGSVYGDSDFWDYVIVEGFSGTEWIPLIDGYDARANGDWLDAYDGDQNGTGSMFVSHTIDLLDFFNPGDTVLIRFRMFTDQFVTSWGWAIDNVSIQEDLVSVEDNMLPTIYSLNQNYPNPFNPSTIITYSVPKVSDVALKIYSVTGELVKVLVDGNFKPGNYEVKFNASQLASGVYFYRLTAGDFVQTKKMMLIK